MKTYPNLIYGRNPIEEAFNNNLTLSKVFLQKGLTGPLEKLCRHYCKDHQIPLSIVPKEKLNRMAPNNHQGVVAWISPVDYINIEQLISHLFEKVSLPLLVLLDGVSDTRNVGAIARSAWVLGADGIIISTKNTAPINEVTVKSSAGAVLNIPISRVPTVAFALEVLQKSGFGVYASDLNTDKTLEELDMDRPVTLVLGAEGDGISNHTRKYSDALFRIPQSRDFDSLNVSVAAGVCLYEISRLRKNLFTK